LSDTLLVMRYKDMGRIHPKQDNSKTCSKCGLQVGIFPTGQIYLRKFPKAKIICSVCVDNTYDGRTVAPHADMIREARETRPRLPGE
jgi:hypothetical protein